MLDDNVDEIFLTRRQVRKDGIVNRFISEQDPENVLQTISELKSQGSGNILLLLDIAMPRVSGMEVLRKLRKNKDFSDITVIMLSASDDDADVAEAMRLGANGYMVKPFKAETFFAALKNVPAVKQCLVQ